MNLTDFRKTYPQYDRVGDDELKQALHAKNYSQVDYDTFNDAFDPGSLTPAQAEPMPSESDKGFSINEDVKESADYTVKSLQKVAGTPARAVTGLTSAITKGLGSVATSTLRAFDFAEMVTTGKYVEGKVPEENRFIQPIKDYVKRSTGRIDALTEGEVLNPVEEPYTDLGFSMMSGSAAGMGVRYWKEASKPMAILARNAGITESLAMTGVKSGLASVAGDKLIIDPSLKLIDEKVEESGYSENTKTAIRVLAPITIGLFSGASIENKIESMMGSASAVRTFKSFGDGKLNTKDAVETIADDIVKVTKGKTEAGPEREFAQPFEKDSALNVFIGRNAEYGFDTRIEREAIDLASKGKSVEEIKATTGLHKGKDGEWRAELSDKDAKIKINLSKDRWTYKLSDVLEHPTLYKAYPDLKDTTVALREGPNGGYIIRNDSDGAELISVTASSKDLAKGIALHEVQHSIQGREGFAKGGNTDMIDSMTRVHSEKMQQLDKLLADGSVSEAVKAGPRKMRKEIAKSRKKLQTSEEYNKLVHGETRLGEAYSRLSEAVTPNVQKFWQNEVQLRGAEVQDLGDVYKGAVHRSYENIAGEFEANQVITRKDLSDAELKTAKPELGDNTYVLRGSDGDARATKESGPRLIIKDSRERPFLRLHPSTITGPLGGIAAGTSYDNETGEVNFDPNQALMGAFIGTLGGQGIKTANRIGKSWTDFAGANIWDALRDTTNGMITNEWIRRQFSLGRAKEFDDLKRNYTRDAEVLMKKATQLGVELNEIAPTGLEQKRLLQLMRGGISSSPEMAAKAQQVQGMFKSFRKSLKEFDLVNYSRFDDLTKKQRSEWKHVIDNKESTPEQVQEAVTKLSNYYKFASAKEYAPIFYAKHEGLTSTDKANVNDEISQLKKQSRYKNPEGDPELEDQIAQLEQLLKSSTKRVINTKRQQLNQGYAHTRQEISQETQRYLKPINSAAYTSAKGAAVQGTDILRARLLTDIAENPQWTKTFKEGEYIPADYIKVKSKDPNQPKGKSEFGPLEGKYVKNYIYDDLVDTFELRNEYVKNWDKMMGYWKYGKVILSPATHARNFVSNAVLAYAGDVHPADAVTYGQATRAMVKKEGDEFYREASDWGLMNTSFVSSELGNFRASLESIREPSKVRDAIRKAVAAPAALYEGNEHVFKMAVFIKARKSGLSIDAAGRKAEEHLFNYKDIPPVVRSYRRWFSPFFTYTYKAVPVMAKTALTKPWKPGLIGLAAYGMQKYSENQMGKTPEESKREKSFLPGGAGDLDLTTVLLPFKDDHGNDLYFNMTPFMPWGNIGSSWGKSSIPLGDWLPNNPVWELASTFKFNKDSYTGQQVYDEILDSNRTITQKYLEVAWKQLTPALAPGGSGAKKLGTGFRNSFMDAEEKDWMGVEMGMGEAAMSALAGLKLTRSNEETMNKIMSIEMKKIQRALGVASSKLKRDFQRGTITKEELIRELQSIQQVGLEKQLERVEDFKQE